MKINKYLPFAILYFFFNSVGLPFGLTWMALLAPFFYIWVLLTRKKEILLPFLAVMLPFIIIHIALVGVELKVYLVSLALILMVYIFCQAFYTFLIKCPDPEKLFHWLLIGNFICCLLGIIFYFTAWVDLFWMIMPTFMPEAPSVGVWELAPFMGTVALFLFLTMRAMGKGNVVPGKDPYLVESLSTH